VPSALPPETSAAPTDGDTVAAARLRPHQWTLTKILSELHQERAHIEEAVMS
jgi:hypothetical protein